MKKKLESTPEKTQLSFILNHSFTGAAHDDFNNYLKDHGEAKSAEQRPTERVLFFTHIPKCAGKGIQTIFKRRLYFIYFDKYYIYFNTNNYQKYNHLIQYKIV